MRLPQPLHLPTLVAVSVISFAGTVSSASAATFNFITPAGSTVTDGAVSASAAFTTSAGLISVTLTDLLANPTSVGQLLSDISFTYSGSALASNATLSSSSGQDITVAAGGTFTTGGTVSTGWNLSAVGTSGLHLDALGGGQPEHLIIGPPAPGPGGIYSNANGSIAANDPHNPFLNQTATFNIALVGITPETLITSAIFSFGTNEGGALVQSVPGAPGVPGPTAATPVPGALPLFATGLGALGLLGWRRKRKRAA